MLKKPLPIISVIVITILAVLFLYDSNSLDRELLAETFVVDAIYYEDKGYVEISFSDTTKQTNSVVLEILGMKDSFQKTFVESSFVEQITFESTPKYGWKIHPITFVVDHQELGKIGIKTEIHSVNEAAPTIIYSNP